MTSIALNPATVPSSPCYSHGIEVRDAGQLVLVSGQVGMTSDGEVVEGVEAQAVQAVANLNAVPGEAGLTHANLAKLTIYLTDPADVEPFIGAVGGVSATNPNAVPTIL